MLKPNVVSSHRLSVLIEFLPLKLPPPLPPRSYLPQAPPSQLPALLQSLARTIGVLSATSGIALWIYQVRDTRLVTCRIAAQTYFICLCTLRKLSSPDYLTHLRLVMPFECTSSNSQESWPLDFRL